MTDLRTWNAWKTIHQPFELEWWREHLAEGHSTTPDWFEMWAEVREFIEPHGDTIDIGAGPRPPFTPCTVIDPLALEYQKITPAEWWEGVTIHAQPAEVRIGNLAGDTIICWNCLDHTIGWKNILDNMLAYGRPGARYAVATDFYEPFTGHPGYPREQFEAEINARFTVIKRREPFGRQLALLMTRKND